MFTKLKNLLTTNTITYQQARNNIDKKVKLIKPLLRKNLCLSVLDVGCNSGELGRQLSTDYFCLGIDQKLDLTNIKQPLNNHCLGQIELNENVLKMIPKFDAVCLFGVHHQWYKEFGEERCRTLVKSVFDTATKAFFIQFAGINSKYLKNSTVKLFEDNHEESIKNYAINWLNELLIGRNAEYLGKTSETKGEPFRYIFYVKV